jgi:ABC-type multidrug transport system ATPase subunit
MLEALALARLHLGPFDFSVAPGECLAIGGASGAGKSVLLRMLADLDPHGGDARLDGQACSAMPAPRWRSQVTYVPAESGWWDAKVGAHFAAPGGFVAEGLAALGLPADAAAWPVARLSTGERQRLALLRAITPATRALLLDEPTSGLDDDSAARVEALLRAQLARGLAIVLVTHQGAQAARLAHRRLLLQGGRLWPFPAGGAAEADATAPAPSARPAP